MWGNRLSLPHKSQCTLVGRMIFGASAPRRAPLPVSLGFTIKLFSYSLNSSSSALTLVLLPKESMRTSPRRRMRRSDPPLVQNLGSDQVTQRSSMRKFTLSFPRSCPGVAERRASHSRVFPHENTYPRRGSRPVNRYYSHKYTSRVVQLIDADRISYTFVAQFSSDSETDP